jgi:hypothetical protein
LSIPTVRNFPKLNDFSPDFALDETVIPLVRRRLSGLGDMGNAPNLGVSGGSKLAVLAFTFVCVFDDPTISELN